ncbi:MAG: helix-turn-helix domain-containing protein [Chloroflexota bacterium]|nr:helix-turn-helix domain-containing protein [Chloroflexota bacterium]
MKAGRTEAGSQRYRCGTCQRRYTPEPKAHGYSDEMRQQAVKLYSDGLNYRRIGRVLRVDHVTVMLWVKAHTDQLPLPVQPDEVGVIELDELFTFVGKKKTKSTS